MAIIQNIQIQNGLFEESIIDGDIIAFGQNKVYLINSETNNYKGVNIPVSNVTDSWFFGDTGYALTSTGKVIKTENAGYSWTLVYTFSLFQQVWRSIVCLDEDTVIVGGRYSIDRNGGIIDRYAIIYKSTDGGNSFSKVLDNERSAPIVSISFPSTNVGIAVVNDAVFKTTDAGSNWSVEASYPSTIPSFNTVSMSSNSVGIAGTSSSTPGLFYETVNGGSIWNVIVPQNQNKTITDSVPVDGGKYYACDNEGIVYKFTGSSHTTESVASTSLNSIHFRDVLKGATCGGQKVYITNDGFNSWTNIDLGEALGSVFYKQ